MVQLLVIGIGGFLGAIARFGITTLIHRNESHGFPFGTMVANVLGCFLMGILVYLIQEKEVLPPMTRGFLLVGLLGALTTFSTFSLETVRLMQTGQWVFAFTNVLTSVLFCLGALMLGRLFVKWIAA